MPDRVFQHGHGFLRDRRIRRWRPADAVGRILGCIVAALFWASSVCAQSDINLTSGTLEIGLKWGLTGLDPLPWSSWLAAGSIQVVADGVLNATVSDSVTTLNRLPVTNTVVHLYYRGSTAGDGRELVLPRAVTLKTNQTTRLDYDLTSALSLVQGTVTLNGGVPPAFRLVTLSDGQGNPWIGARTDDRGLFRAFVPPGSGTGQVLLVPGQGGFSYTVGAGDFLNVGVLALTSASLRLDLSYFGRPVSELNAAGSVALSATDVFGRIVDFSQGTVLLGNLAAQSVTMRVGYGAVAFEPGVLDLVQPIGLILQPGTNPPVTIPLERVLGVLTGVVELNGSPAPKGTQVALLTPDGRSLATGAIDATGRFKFLAPAGSGKGQVYLVDGQGAFSYTIQAGVTTDLPTLRLGSGAVEVRLKYNGKPISALNANTAILIRADGILTNTLTQDSTIISNLPPASGALRVGFGSAIFATDSDYLASTTSIPIEITAGQTFPVLLDLCGPLGLVQGTVNLNQKPVPAGTLVNLTDYAGRGYVTAATDSQGTFRALVPSGPGKGHVLLIAGQGDFSFHVQPCGTTDLGGVLQNQIPQLDPIAPQTVIAGSQLTFQATGHDTDSSVALSFSLEDGAPDGAVIDPSGLFRWTPPFSTPGGTVKVLVTGTDSGTPPSSDTVQVLITVRPHQAPQVTLTTPVDGFKAVPPVVLQIAATASAFDNQSIRQVAFFSESSRLGISPNSPYSSRWSNVPLGDHLIYAVATDTAGARATSAPVHVTIALPANLPPVIDPVPQQIGVETREFDVVVTARDPDAGQTLAFALGAGAPAGATLDTLDGTSALLQWTPPRGEGLRSVTIPVVVTDSGKPPQSALLQVPFLVNAYVAPKVSIAGPADGSSAVAPASFGMTASLVAGTSPVRNVGFYRGEALLGTVSAAPYQMAVTGLTVGNYSFTARATDILSVVATSAPVRVSVVLPPNRPPVFDAPGVVSQVEGKEFIKTLHAVDPDAGQVVAYSLGTGSPAGAVIEASTGVLRWTPPLGPGGRSQEFVVVATDNGTPQQQTTLRFTLAVLAHVAPTVRLSAPLAGATAVAPGSFHLIADATGGTDGIQRVEFYRDEVKIGSATGAPFQLDWSGAGVGTYSLTARAFDLAGVSAISPQVRVSVTPAGPPAGILLIQPVAGSVAFSPAPISFAVAVTNLDAAVTRIEYLSGSAVVASSDTAPYATEWIATDSGNYTFSARAVLSSGATVISPSVTISVGGHRSAVVLVNASEGPESASIQDALTKLGHTVDLLAAPKVGPTSLFGYRLAIWNDAGDSNAVISEAIVNAFERAISAGTPLYFVGERLFAAAAGLDSGLKKRWYALLHAVPSGVAPASGLPITFESVATDHPLLHARSGLVEDFTYTGSLESADAGEGDVEIAGTARGRPVLLMAPSAESPDDLSRHNTVTQFFLRTRTGDAVAASARDALSGNAIEWLIGNLCFSQVVRVETTVSPETVNVGDEFTLTLLVSAHGECGATGVEIIQSLPASWTVVAADATRGTVSHSPGTVGYSLGRLPLLIPETVTLRIRPTTPGTVTNLAQIHWNEEPVASAQVAESVITVVGTLAPGLDLHRDLLGHLILHSSAAPNATLQLESSANLRQWIPLQTLGGGVRTIDLGVPVPGADPLFYRTRVLP